MNSSSGTLPLCGFGSAYLLWDGTATCAKPELSGHFINAHTASQHARECARPSLRIHVATQTSKCKRGARTCNCHVYALALPTMCARLNQHSGVHQSEDAPLVTYTGQVSWLRLPLFMWNALIRRDMAWVREGVSMRHVEIDACPFLKPDGGGARRMVRSRCPSSRH